MPTDAGKGRDGKRNRPTGGAQDVRIDPATADTEDREAEARARAADGRQRGG